MMSNRDYLGVEDSEFDENDAARLASMHEDSIYEDEDILREAAAEDRFRDEDLMEDFN